MMSRVMAAPAAVPIATGTARSVFHPPRVVSAVAWCLIGIVLAMEYTGDPGFADVDARWIVGGPDSGGVRFFVLWRGYLFLVEQDFSSGSIGPGIAAAEFAATHRGTSDPRYQQIVADLDARDRSH